MDNLGRFGAQTEERRHKTDYVSMLDHPILICVAMTINLISSVIAGMVVPIILRRLNQDPAIAGSVVVTTVTDVVGFFSFLGLATIFLIN